MAIRVFYSIKTLISRFAQNTMRVYMLKILISVKWIIIFSAPVSAFLFTQFKIAAKFMFMVFKV